MNRPPCSIWVFIYALIPRASPEGFPKRSPFMGLAPPRGFHAGISFLIQKISLLWCFASTKGKAHIFLMNRKQLTKLRIDKAVICLRQGCMLFCASSQGFPYHIKSEISEKKSAGSAIKALKCLFVLQGESRL